MNKTNDKPLSLNRVDLNLFRVFAAIYKEKNITRASEKLFISQPAVSHALSRLRTHFNDPLFIRDGQGVEPSQLAKRIWPSIETSLNLLNSTIQSTLSFLPQRDIRKITVAMNDELEPILLPLIIDRFFKLNPDISIKSVRINRKNLKAELSSGRIDFAVDITHLTDAGVSQKVCLHDNFVVISSDKFSKSGSLITLDDYLKAQHITVSSRPSGKVFEDLVLSKHGIKRSVKIRCQQYQTAVNTIKNSNFLLTISNCQAIFLKKIHQNIDIHPIPIETNNYSISLYWDEDKSEDLEIDWCKKELLQILNSLLDVDN
ncbi:LysR family transcriptional regulator [Acinetobacter radioresistens]|uniref:LysR family transcriptional regulator n=1 Tax=Acinetobacter radioresistens TaxID=40216 RepID=UPI00094668AC|nr:LysR family transcriptional regulator [Acinetobacter radioresistens]